MAGDVRQRSFTVLALDGWLAAPPAAVWPFITEPDRLNEWSTAPVRALEPGDGGGAGTVGASRRVLLPRPLPPVTEVVQHADAPTRFVYRAVGSRAIRYHRGEILLSAAGGGTRLRWDAGMAFAAPGATAFVERVLRPQVTDSVRRLAALVAGAPEPEVRLDRFRDDHDPRARSSAQASADALGALADAMRSRGDPRQWFSRVYQYVTEEIVDACDRGDVAHPTWALRLVPRFHELYAANLEGSPEPHWRQAFTAIQAAGGELASGALPFWQALVAGARAHIEGDLPRVLAATFAAHYLGRCDYDRFRADFLLLAAPLQTAWRRLSAHVPARWFPPYLRVLDRLLPPEAVEHLTARRFYDPMPARRAAFDRGRRLLAAPAPGDARPTPTRSSRAAWR